MNRLLTGGLAACCLLSAPAALQAADSRGGIELGPTRLYPALGLEETYDDNITLTSDARRSSDWVTTVSPALRLVLPVQRYYLEAEGELDVIRYREHDEEDSTDWLVGAAAGADFPGGLRFRIGDTLSEYHLIGSQEYGPGETVSENHVEGTVAYTVRDAMRLELAGSRRTYEYVNSLDRDRSESLLQATLFWQFRPLVSALFEAGREIYRYDITTAQDGSATHVSLGLTWDVTERSTGLAKAGYEWKRYEEQNETLGTTDGEFYILSVGLDHTFSRRTKSRIELSRSSEESDFPMNPYYLRNSLGAGVSHRFTWKIYGRAGLRAYSDSYPNDTSYLNPYDVESGVQTGTRTDQRLDWNLAAGYDAARWLVLELEYGREQRDSSFDTFDYTANRVTFSLKASF